MDNELLKKPWNIRCKEEKRKFTTHHRKEFGGVKWGCEMLKMARSSYYYHWVEDFQRQKEDADLRDKIEKIVAEHPRCGYRGVAAQLKRKGVIINHKRLLKVMQEEPLICVRSKRDG